MYGSGFSPVFSRLSARSSLSVRSGHLVTTFIGSPAVSPDGGDRLWIPGTRHPPYLRRPAPTRHGPTQFARQAWEERPHRELPDVDSWVKLWWPRPPPGEGLECLPLCEGLPRTCRSW